MSNSGKNFAEQGGAKQISMGIGDNTGFNKEAFVEALFNGGPDEKILASMKDSATAEKSPSKLLMNLIDKGLDISTHKELTAGINEDIKTDTTKIIKLDRAPTAKEIQMYKSAKIHSA